MDYRVFQPVALAGLEIGDPAALLASLTSDPASSDRKQAVTVTAATFTAVGSTAPVCRGKRRGSPAATGRSRAE
jgi:hypothetical protein